MTDDPATRAARRIRSEAIYVGAYDSNIAAAIIRSEHAPAQGESADGWLPLAQEIESLRGDLDAQCATLSSQRAEIERLTRLLIDVGDHLMFNAQLTVAMRADIDALSPPARDDVT